MQTSRSWYNRAYVVSARRTTAFPLVAFKRAQLQLVQIPVRQAGAAQPLPSTLRRASERIASEQFSISPTRSTAPPPILTNSADKHQALKTLRILGQFKAQRDPDAQPSFTALPALSCNQIFHALLHGRIFLQSFSLTQLANTASAMAAAGVSDPLFLHALAEEATLQLQRISGIYQQQKRQQEQQVQARGSNQQQQHQQRQREGLGMGFSKQQKEQMQQSASKQRHRASSNREQRQQQQQGQLQKLKGKRGRRLAWHTWLGRLQQQQPLQRR